MDSYNIGNLAADSFGGETTSFTSQEKDIYNTAGGNWGKSAYMLIYERRVKKHIREVDIENSKEDDEKVSLVDYRAVEPHVPS